MTNIPSPFHFTRTYSALERFVNGSPLGASSSGGCGSNFLSVLDGFYNLASNWTSTPSVGPFGGGQSSKTAALSAFKKAIAAKAKRFLG